MTEYAHCHQPAPAQPSVADILALPAVRVGRPRIVAGRSGLANRVRWVQVGDRPDVADYLRGGELVLTTLDRVASEPADVRRRVARLVSVGVCGLVVELGSTADPPSSLVDECERIGLPLVVLDREVRFVNVTEAVHSLIVNAEVAGLQTVSRAEAEFGAICAAGADAAQIVEIAATIADAPVVFENVLHEVVAVAAAGLPADDLLAGWPERSRRVPGGAGSAAGPERWVVEPVVVRDMRCGRVVMLPGERPSVEQVMVLERAARALAVCLRVAGAGADHEGDAHRSLLAELVHDRPDAGAGVRARLRALGIPVEGHELIAMVVEPWPAGPVDAAGLRAVRDAVRSVQRRALVAPIGPRRLAALVPVAGFAGRRPLLARLADAVHRADGPRLRVGVGRPVNSVRDTPLAFAEAGQVLDALDRTRDGGARPYYELADLSVRGLLALHRSDPSWQQFAEGALGRLLDHDVRHAGDLLACLRAYLAAYGNKSAAAATVHLARQSFHHRIARIERLLDVDLRSGETCTSLHAALMVLDEASDGQGVHDRARSATPCQ